MFCNDRNSPEFDEFLAILGERVELKNFAGYRGGLDTVNEQTGKTSVYTKYRDRYVCVNLIFLSSGLFVIDFSL